MVLTVAVIMSVTIMIYDGVSSASMEVVIHDDVTRTR
jgi:hypothetical protein